MTDLNMKPIIQIRKDKEGIYWIDFPDEMPEYELMGIFQMMIRRLERSIFTEEQKIMEKKGTEIVVTK